MLKADAGCAPSQLGHRVFLPSLHAGWYGYFLSPPRSQAAENDDACREEACTGHAYIGLWASTSGKLIGGYCREELVAVRPMPSTPSCRSWPCRTRPALIFSEMCGRPACRRARREDGGYFAIHAAAILWMLGSIHCSTCFARVGGNDMCRIRPR